MSFSVKSWGDKANNKTLQISTSQQLPLQQWHRRAAAHTSPTPTTTFSYRCLLLAFLCFLLFLQNVAACNWLMRYNMQISAPNTFPKVAFYSKKNILQVYPGQSQPQKEAFPLKLGERNPTVWHQCFFDKEAEANILHRHSRKGEERKKKRKKPKVVLWTANKHKMQNPYQDQCFCFLKSPCKSPEISWAFQLLAAGLHSPPLTPL